MSDKQENTEEQPDAPEATAAPIEESEQASVEVSASTPSANKAVIFGTRKSKPGSNTASNAKSLDQVRGIYDDEDEIEMDDLPVRATAPEHLIASERSPRPERSDEHRERPNRRERSNDRPRSRRRDEPSTAPSEEKEAAANTEEDANAPSVEATLDDRPDRFGSISDETLAARKANNIEEFRPSRDGRTSTKTHKAKLERQSRPAPKAAPTKKKGFFAWLKSLFAPEEEVKKPSQNRNNRGRGGQNRRREGDEGSGEGQSRRPRRRGPRRGGNRPRGEGDNRGEGQNRRPRRRGPRRSGNGGKGPRRESSND